MAELRNVLEEYRGRGASSRGFVQKNRRFLLFSFGLTVFLSASLSVCLTSQFTVSLQSVDNLSVLFLVVHMICLFICLFWSRACSLALLVWLFCSEIVSFVPFFIKL